MRLLLAAMPWQSIHRPSLPIGLLHSVLERDRPAVEVLEYHGSIRWGEYLGQSGIGSPEIYTRIADYGVFQGLGDLVFSGSLYDDPQWRIGALKKVAAGTGFDVDTVVQMRAAAAGFVAAAADEILAAGADVVGFTSTFTQNVASLATARRLKQLRPGLRVVFGGGNCDGPMGHALHRNHRFVDYVVRGEGEEVFPLLLDRLADEGEVGDVSGVCWWDDGGTSVANPVTGRSVPPTMIPIPDFTGWQRAFNSSPFRTQVRPELVVESSRGCWWGEKHHCTFCGLNGSLMAFRGKPAAQFWHELSTLVERHQLLDVKVTDNILSMDYFNTLLPLMAAADWDLRMHFEVKANLRPDQIAALVRAGIVMVQPGVENLSSRVLRLMDKGVDGAANVQVLRDCEDQRMTVDWNYLYGFPGERDEDYLSIIDQMPALVHLPPPDIVNRIWVERFSPYFDRPELGFSSLRPSSFFRAVYDLPEDELYDLVYFFDSEWVGIGGAVEELLATTLERWLQAYPYSTLVAEDRGAELVVHDRRQGWTPGDRVLAGWQADAYRTLSRRRSPKALCSALRDHGHQLDLKQVEEWLHQARSAGLVFVDDNHWVALATSTAPLKATPDTKLDGEPAERVRAEPAGVPA